MKWNLSLEAYVEKRTPEIFALLTDSEVVALSNMLIPSLRHSALPESVAHGTRQLALQGCVAELATLEHEARCESLPERIYGVLHRNIVRDRGFVAMVGGKDETPTTVLRAANDTESADAVTAYGRAVAMKNQLEPAQKQEILLHMGYSPAMAEVNAPAIDREALAAELAADPTDSRRAQWRARAALGHAPDLSGASALFDLLRKVAAQEPPDAPFSNAQIVDHAKTLWTNTQAQGAAR